MRWFQKKGEPTEKPAANRAADAIDACRFFDSVDFEWKDKLKAAAFSKRFAAGQTVIEEGTKSTDLFLVVSGRVAVDTRASGASVRLAELGSGDLVGEVAALTGVARTSTVTAVDHVEIAVVPGEVVSEMLKANPEIRSLLLKVIEARAMEAISKTVPGSED